MKTSCNPQAKKPAATNRYFRSRRAALRLEPASGAAGASEPWVGLPSPNAHGIVKAAMATRPQSAWCQPSALTSACASGTITTCPTEPSAAPMASARARAAPG